MTGLTRRRPGGATHPGATVVFRDLANAVPAQLKAWFDRVLKAGVTFKYTDTGPVGLAGGRRFIIASSRGGAYGDNSPMDLQEPYLKTLLGLIGLTDVTVLRAQGSAMGDEARKAGIAQALAAVASLQAAPAA